MSVNVSKRNSGEEACGFCYLFSNQYQNTSLIKQSPNTRYCFSHILFTFPM